MRLLVIVSGYLVKMLLPALAGAALCLVTAPWRRKRLSKRAPPVIPGELSPPVILSERSESKDLPRPRVIDGKILRSAQDDKAVLQDDKAVLQDDKAVLRWETTWGHEAGLALLTAFVCGLFALVVLPSGRPAGELHCNLIPFQILFDVAEEVRLGNILGLVISFLGNIVMFLPLGFLPALLWRGVGWRRAVLIGFVCSLTIELCQLPLGRSGDVDDLWLNTLGSAAGYGIYHLLDGWKPRWTKACKVKYTESKEEE